MTLLRTLEGWSELFPYAFSCSHRFPRQAPWISHSPPSPSAADSGQQIRNLCAEGGQWGFCEVLGETQKAWGLVLPAQ